MVKLIGLSAVSVVQSESELDDADYIDYGLAKRELPIPPPPEADGEYYGTYQYIGERKDVEGFCHRAGIDDYSIIEDDPEWTPTTYRLHFAENTRLEK